MNSTIKARLSRAGAIAVLMLLALAIAIVLSSCGSQSALPYHQGLQREASFEKRYKQNQSFTLPSLREDTKALRSDLRKQRKLNSINSKKKQAEKTNAELREKIKQETNNP